MRSVRTPAFTGDLAVTTFQRCRRQSDSFQRHSGSTTSRVPAQPRTLALVETEPGGSHEIWLRSAGRTRVRLHGDPAFRALGAASRDFRIFDVSNPSDARPRWARGARSRELGAPAEQGTFVALGDHERRRNARVSLATGTSAR